MFEVNFVLSHCIGERVGSVALGLWDFRADCSQVLEELASAAWGLGISGLT